ncbi:MAG: hypothetical protein IKA61_05530 [Clostridia bacterium]|nr:hypothetical protein [Clostridia bacterium]
MIKSLLEYQNVDTELRDIETSLKQSEERKKASSAKSFLTGANESVAKLDQRAEDLVGKFNASVKLLSQLEEQAKEYEGIDEMDENQLSYVKKKAQALNEEISNLASAVDSLSKEIESVLKEFAQLKSDIKKAKAQYSEYGPKYNELKASKEDEMNKIKARLKKLEAGIDAEILEKYKQRRNDRIFPVLNEAKEMSKHAYCRCGTELSLTDYGNLKNGNIVECDSCHRLLYLSKT